MRRRRRLSDEEQRLWADVARSTEPLKGRRRPMAPAPILAEAAPPPPSPDPAPVRATASPDERPRLPSLPQHPIERPTKRRIARGRLAIEARIDLHEMTQERAHDALAGFLRRAQAMGFRHVLVITGHGNRASVPGRERGVLRRMVPLWFKGQAFRPLVSGFEAAERHHGGAGALYVRVRRRP